MLMQKYLHDRTAEWIHKSTRNTTHWRWQHVRSGHRGDDKSNMLRKVYLHMAKISWHLTEHYKFHGKVHAVEGLQFTPWSLQSQAPAKHSQAPAALDTSWLDSGSCWVSWVSPVPAALDTSLGLWRNGSRCN